MPRDGDASSALACLVADDVVVDLAGAEDEPADGLLVATVDVVEHRPEAPVGEIVERRRRVLEAQQALRRHHDERARARVERLAAQQVEVLRGRRAVRDPDVLLRGELQEALEPRARVLRPVALVRRAGAAASAATSAPTSRGRSTMNWSMIDLRAVDEVAELRLPEHERLRRGDRVAVLEADARVLGERRVVDLERRRRVGADAGSASQRSPFVASCRTRWRCENVPRSVSWPVSRIGIAVDERATRTRAPRPGPSRSRLRRARRGGARAGARASGEP